MFNFKMKRKGQWLWRTYKVVGFGLDEGKDRMTLYQKNGVIREIAHFSDCDIHLGEDYFLERKEKMESAAGQPLPINKEALGL